LIIGREKEGAKTGVEEEKILSAAARSTEKKKKEEGAADHVGAPSRKGIDRGKGGKKYPANSFGKRPKSARERIEREGRIPSISGGGERGSKSLQTEKKRENSFSQRLPTPRKGRELYFSQKKGGEKGACGSFKRAGRRNKKGKEKRGSGNSLHRAKEADLLSKRRKGKGHQEATTGGKPQRKVLFRYQQGERKRRHLSPSLGEFLFKRGVWKRGRARRQQSRHLVLGKDAGEKGRLAAGGAGRKKGALRWRRRAEKGGGGKCS